MDVSVIISKSRIQTGTSVWQKSDALMLTDLNIVKDTIFSALWVVSKKYARQQYNPTTTVVGQSEYILPAPSAVDNGLKRLLRVDIKYNSSSDWKQCKVYDTNPTSEDLSLYTDTNAPICIQRDGSIMVYPAPTEAIANGIKIEWSYIPKDMELNTTSDQIKLKPEDHKILLYGLNAWNFADKQLFDKEAVHQAKYDLAMKTLISQWAGDIEDWYQEVMPDLSELE